MYDTTEGGRKLVAAMYMVKPGTPLDAVPDIGGGRIPEGETKLCDHAHGT